MQRTGNGLLSTGIALGVHKLLAAWALGVTFHRARSSKRRYAALGTLFVLAAPLLGAAFVNQ